MNTGQSKRHSLFESISNVVVGFGISTGANCIVLPWFGYNVSPADAVYIGIVFTLISLARSYILRRVFNRLWVKKQSELQYSLFEQ